MADETAPSTDAAMLAVLGHVASGDLAAAEAAMAGVTDAELCAIDAPPLWDPFRAAGFTYGQARLTSLFRQYQTQNLGLRLWCMPYVIDSEPAAAALRELQDLLALDGAFAHSVQFLGCYVRLGRLDLFSDASENLDRGTAAPRAERIRIGFDLAANLQAADMRPALFRQLQRLDELCAGDLPLTLRLSGLYVGIGERSFALDALNLLKGDAADAPLAKLARAQLVTPHRDEIRTSLRALRTEPTTEWEFWLNLSYAAQGFDEPALALEAARKAVAHAPADPVWLQIRLAEVLVSAGQKKAAAAEVEALVSNEAAMRFSAQPLAATATRCGRPDLALGIGERWVKSSPDDLQARIMLCVYARDARDDAKLRDAAETAMDRVRTGSSLTREQFKLLIDSIGGVSAARDGELAAAAFRQHPRDAEFQALAKPDTFAARFRSADAAGARDAPKKRRGLRALLGL